MPLCRLPVHHPRFSEFAMEVKCGSVTMPGEGISIAIHKVTGWPFPKAKIRVDITLVVLAVLFCFLLLGSWKWEIVASERSSPWSM